MAKKDILIYFSDQHAGKIAGYAGDKLIRTPNLDKIAAEGTFFRNAYTSCPLCVPARMSLLTGQLPYKTGIYSNASPLPSGQPTFLHSLGAAGYETVLCGRMHFIGPDQRHGFTKRIAGDITPLYNGDTRLLDIRGKYKYTLRESNCLDIIGGGNSPTLEYDRYVTNAALDYLNIEHEKPQCVVVGTYAPHFPYVAPPELYRYYLDKVTYPESLSEGYNYSLPILEKKNRDVSKETVIKVRAAYYGMIEFTDSLVGAVYDAWSRYLKESGREGIFIYFSDHGDQAGERSIFGKETFFESSAHIPVIFQGSGVRAGGDIHAPASIMDIGPTLCELAGAEPLSEQDGVSQFLALTEGRELEGRSIICETRNRFEKKNVLGRMVRKNQWKYMHYDEFDGDLLFDMERDPDELHNAAKEQPGILADLRTEALKNWDTRGILEKLAKQDMNNKILANWGAVAEPDNSERWVPTAASIEYPEEYRD